MRWWLIRIKPKFLLLRWLGSAYLSCLFSHHTLSWPYILIQQFSTSSAKMTDVGSFEKRLGSSPIWTIKPVPLESVEPILLLFLSFPRWLWSAQGKNGCPKPTTQLPVPGPSPMTATPPSLHHRQRTYSSFWNSSTRLDFWPGDILAKMVPFISI